MSWEYLPPLGPPGTLLARPSVTSEKASKIFLAYVHGCTKGEIARVFGERLDVVREVIGVAREAALKARETNQ